ncbi:DUF6265 family protein [Marinoscillum sp. MHG1-6]|uniref:DUF6265 family protein n=1 Tax=Marinoscillum sp. MHG1-6 TaxID=2959627 RepID=UPI0021585BB9|nr:DUF6265 family protein [Marinoscillum sp. MHG1-6]
MRSYLLVFVTLLTFSCTEKESLDQFYWMEGLWLKDDPDSMLYSCESWTKITPFEMSGFGMTLDSGDTIFYEELQIISGQSDIYYIADVGDGPVSFKLTQVESDRWVFENPEHDFPQRIVYTKTDSTMTAYTEAAQVSIPFRFKRAKE